MSKQLDELLFTIRQHPAFTELLTSVEQPLLKEFRPTADADAQHAEHIFRSGQRRQHEYWRQLLIGGPSSQQERS